MLSAPAAAHALHWRLLPPALLAPGDRPTRIRALALLRAATAAGASPCVPGWGPEQWGHLGDLLHVLEEHMFHLLQPVWSSFMPRLLEAAEAAAETGTGAGAEGEAAGAASSNAWRLGTWLAVPMLKACQHVNVSVRRLGLISVLQWAVRHDGSSTARPAAWWATLLQAPGASPGPGPGPGPSPDPGSGASYERQQPALWLLAQLLPTAEADKLSREWLPGCAASARHAAAVVQLRSAFATFLAASLRHATGAAAAAAAALIEVCLGFALHGTQRATAAAFALAGLRGALADMSRGGGGGGGSVDEGTAVAAAAVVRTAAGGVSGLLRSSLLPLLTRTALQNPRDVQIQIHEAVLDLVPYLLDPGAVAVRDALELLAAALPEAAGVGAAAAAPGAPESRGPALWRSKRFVGWLSAALEGRGGEELAVAGWLAKRLMLPRLPPSSPGAAKGAAAAASTATAASTRAADVQALAAAAPHLAPRLQLAIVQSLFGAAAASTAAAAAAAAMAQLQGGGSAGAAGAATAAAELGAGPTVDTAAMLSMLVALHRAYGGGGGRASAAATEALHGTTRKVAPMLLSDFWRRQVERRCWDERTAYGILQLTEVLSGAAASGGGGGGGSNAYEVCAGWREQLLRAFGSGAASVGGDSGGVGAAVDGKFPLDEQLALLTAACVMLRVTRVAVVSSDGASPAAAATVTVAGTAAHRETALALLVSVCDMEPSLELSPALAASAGGAGGGGGGGGAVRMGLLPVFLELKWRLLAEALAVAAEAAPGAGGALPWPAREALCERVLQDLDCAPDAAMPYILDAALAAAPYDEALRAVTAAAAAVVAATSPPSSVPPAPNAADVGDRVGDSTPAAAAAAAETPTAAEGLLYLRLLTRLQAAVLAALRGSRRVAADVAVRAPALAIHPALFLAGNTAAAAAGSSPGPGPELELLAAARAAAATTTSSVLPALLTGGAGGSRVALAAAATLCRRLLGPHPELAAPAAGSLGPPLVHLLGFSVVADSVDAKGLLGRKFEPHQALPARAAVCAWLARLGGPRYAPLLEGLMCGLLRAACGCRRGSMPPGMEDTAGGAQAEAEAEAGGDAAAAPQGPEAGRQRQRRRRGGAGAEGASGVAAVDYSFLASREASQSSTFNAMKVAVWQSIVLLSRRLSEEAAARAAPAVWSCLQSGSLHANVRPLLQTALLSLLDRWPAGAASLLLPALRSYDTASYQAGRAVCVSLVLVGSLLLRRAASAAAAAASGSASGAAAGAAEAAARAESLLSALLPWALHHRHAVRVPVQAPTEAEAGGAEASEATVREGTQQDGAAPAPAPTSPPPLPPLLDGLRLFLGTHPEQAALRSRQALCDFAAFDLEAETSLVGLFGIREEVLMAAADAGEALEIDPGHPSPWALHTRDRLPIDVLRALPAIVRALGARRQPTAAAAAAGGATGDAAAAAADGGDEEDGDEAPGVGADEDYAEEGQACDPEEEDSDGEAGREMAVPGDRQVTASAAATAVAYQLRPQMGPPSAATAAAGTAAVAERLDALAAAGTAAACRPTGLVVVASLLENIPNMAGLCRTCESLGCEALVLPSRAVVASEAFKRQAVTSERWLPLREVGPRDLPAFLTEMRAGGYSLVGVEQAAGSVPLQAYAFPARCVLLLGNEQSGIPQSLIGAMDACVEIPMLGVTRSLNAHVSGAMAVWQYVQQQQRRQGQQHR
ncbi:hypothetical protein GPECTOR_67g275 [Gonium pectorale]|uniref:tRNA/rRNA methyltransferase SpoU type domain-containing protein n=1 Tax=Gonium pectorale TaxID=33097 RepID=A0A150G4I0_GONPE|nr:hypothetical protein GPECTOR_67g275 [Gonium pectorale]|eukprot:KXZ44435.1 hypothetical protein GPECTOR_67g275 [Gonium pectorale]